jgi:hypothetical protein
VSFSHADPEVTIYNGPLFSEIFQEWIVENLSDDLELSSDSDDITIPNKRPILSDELSDDVEDIDKVIEDIDDEISYNPDCDIIRRIQVRSDSRIRNMGSSINLSFCQEYQLSERALSIYNEWKGKITSPRLGANLPQVNLQTEDFCTRKMWIEGN